MGAAGGEELRDLLLVGARSNCTLIAFGVVVTWLSASAIAKILMRIVSSKPALRSVDRARA